MTFGLVVLCSLAGKHTHAQARSAIITYALVEEIKLSKIEPMMKIVIYCDPP